MAMVDTTAWWPATRLRARAAGLHARRKLVDAEKVTPEIAGEAVELIGDLFRVERQAKDFSVEQRLALRRDKSAPVLARLREKLLEVERATAAEASHGGSDQLRPESMG